MHEFCPQVLYHGLPSIPTCSFSQRELMSVCVDPLFLSHYHSLSRTFSLFLTLTLPFSLSVSPSTSLSVSLFYCFSLFLLNLFPQFDQWLSDSSISVIEYLANYQHRLLSFQSGSFINTPVVRNLDSRQQTGE